MRIVGKRHVFGIHAVNRGATGIGRLAGTPGASPPFE